MLYDVNAGTTGTTGSGVGGKLGLYESYVFMHVFSPTNTYWQLGLFGTVFDDVVAISVVKAFWFLSCGAFFFVSMIIACFLVCARRCIFTPNITADAMAQQNLFTSVLDKMWLLEKLLDDSLYNHFPTASVCHSHVLACHAWVGRIARRC